MPAPVNFGFPVLFRDVLRARLKVHELEELCREMRKVIFWAAYDVTIPDETLLDAIEFWEALEQERTYMIGVTDGLKDIAIVEFSRMVSGGGQGNSGIAVEVPRVSDIPCAPSFRSARDD